MKNNILHAQENHLFRLKHINPKNIQKKAFPIKNPKKLKYFITFLMPNSYKMKINAKILYKKHCEFKNKNLHHKNIEKIINWIKNI